MLQTSPPGVRFRAGTRTEEPSGSRRTLPSTTRGVSDVNDGCKGGAELARASTAIVMDGGAPFGSGRLGDLSNRPRWLTPPVGQAYQARDPLRARDEVTSAGGLRTIRPRSDQGRSSTSST